MLLIPKPDFPVPGLTIKYLIRAFLYLTISVNPAFLKSQTNISGGNISGNWTFAGSPYLIEGNIAISETDSLIVEPGVEIIFQDNYLFQIFGKLKAIGAETDSIRFTASSDNGWGGLDFSSQYSSILDYCIVEYSSAAGVTAYFDDYNDDYVELTNSVIRNCNSHGIYLIAGGLRLTNILINNNGGDGVYNSYLPSIEMSNVVISNNVGDGLDLDELNGNINNLKIINNGGNGLYEEAGGGTCEITNLEIKDNGGYGLYVWLGMPQITNFSISGNGQRGMLLGNQAVCINGEVSNNNGGGIYLQYESWSTLNDITIKDNGPVNEGGGIYIEGGCWLSNLKIENNIAQTGGGIFANSIAFEEATISSCEISDNVATGNGGGMYIFYSSDGNHISNTKISGNTAINGAGIYIDTDSPFNGNDFFNTEISNNFASNTGGGIFSLNTGVLNFSKVSIVNNIANFAGGIFNNGSSVSNFSNSIIWGNYPPGITDSTGNLQISYSDIKGGWPGTGNIDADPLFKNITNNDLNLSWANYPLEDYTKSPCIDSGDTSRFDPDGSVIDMGANSFDRNYHNQFMPGIISIDDVPNDQGKSVVLNWSRSILDAPDSGSITIYKIFRMQDWAKDPWELVGTVEAHHFDEYAFIAPTILDSTSEGTHFHKFLVSAETDDPDKYYFSFPDSGYSVDNLKPLQPTNLSGYVENNYIKLFWDKATDEDFSYFAIYKSEDQPDFPDEPFKILSDTVFADTTIFADSIYYYVTAFDFNGNESPHSDTLFFKPGKVLDVKTFLEGPFYFSQMIPYLNLAGLLPFNQPFNVSPWNYTGNESVSEIPEDDIVDWILLDFRDAVDAETAAIGMPVKRMAAFIKTDGSIVGTDGINPPRINLNFKHNLFLVINHRNHLGIMNNTALQENNGIFHYDFSTGFEKYYGGKNGCMEIGYNIWGMASSDADVNGQIDNKDKNDAWTIQNGNSGYLSADFNMDGEVNQQDIDNHWKNNAGHSSLILVSDFGCGESFIDERNGQSYNTVLIGEQCWMAQNLNIGTMLNGNNNQTDNGITEKYCLNNDSLNCNIYGGLYQWNEMMKYQTSNGSQGICPNGWHLPSDSEWDEMIMLLGDYQIAGGEMKEKGNEHWNSPNTGATNSSGFTGLPGGYRVHFNGSFLSSGFTGFYWTSTVSNTNRAHGKFLHYNSTEISSDTSKKLNGFSVRCIKD